MSDDRGEDLDAELQDLLNQLSRSEHTTADIPTLLERAAWFRANGFLDDAQCLWELVAQLEVAEELLRESSEDNTHRKIP